MYLALNDINLMHTKYFKKLASLTHNKEYISIEGISIVYALIGSFLRKNDRLKMVKKFEANKLKYKELLGDHCYFEGGLHLEKKIWTYSLGS